MARRVWIYWLLSVLLTASVGWQSYRGDVARAQREVGSELAAQMARTAAPWVLSQDLTSLNLLIATLEGRPGLDSIEVLDISGRILAQTTHQGWPGERVTLPIQLGSQQLGELRLTLSDPRLGSWLNRRAGPLALIAAVQLIFFVLAGRRPRLSQRIPEAVTADTAMVDSTQTRPVFTASQPLVRRDILICVQPDDRHQLLSRVNADWKEEIQAVGNALLERVARLCDGELVRPLRGPEGALIRLHQGEQQARAWQALCAARLTLALMAQAGQARTHAGLFWIPMQAGLYSHEPGEPGADQVAALLAWAAPSGELLVGGAPALPAATVARATWARTEQLEIAEVGTLEATRLISLPPEAEALIREQVDRLVPLDDAPEARLI